MRGRSSWPGAPGAPGWAPPKAGSTARRPGRTGGAAAEGGSPGRPRGAPARPHNPGSRVPFEPLPGDVTHVPYGDVEALARAIDAGTAAVVLEPVQGEAGVRVPPPGY